MENLSPIDISAFSASRTGFDSTAYSSHADISLILQLQTTLDVETLINIYASEASKYVKFENLSVLFDDQNIRAEDHKKGKFEKQFAITLNGQKIAQLVYETNYVLNDTVESYLSRLHQQLKFSLRNAIEYSRLKRTALKDHLTGLGNRGCFDDIYAQHISHAERSNSEFTLLLIDLDNFKQVNDKHGHDEGDTILQIVAEIIKQGIRESDMAFRFGGDEFAVLLADTDESSGLFVVNRINKTVQKNPLLSKHKVTMSMGLATWKKQETAKSLFIQADQALYQAKHSGRNCYKIA